MALTLVSILVPASVGVVQFLLEVLKATLTSAEEKNAKSLNY